MFPLPLIASAFISTVARAKMLTCAIKPIKYFIDSNFRAQVKPVPGSVLYCDLMVAVEHSGIYLGDAQIADIVVDSLTSADSSVHHSTASEFTSRSQLGRKIYVSCDKHGAVGHPRVAKHAESRIGERRFYGLVFKNCHTFSTECVEQSNQSHDVWSLGISSTWEPTIAELKRLARKKLGATRWRLWDWDGSLADDPPPEPDWQAQQDHFANLPLTPENMARIVDELAETRDYEEEIADESIPDVIRQRLRALGQQLENICIEYEKAKDFLAQCPGAALSYADLKDCPEDFPALAQALRGNASIKELARKMGRNYISEARKKQGRTPEACRSEVHGTQRSNDLMRLLPSELLNLEDEVLENLFYARLLESRLQTYELSGTVLAPGDTAESMQQRTGPVVACLDTSSSMAGMPLLKAKALLLTIANLLIQEQRSLHVLLFGSQGELLEFSMDDAKDSAYLLRFMRQGFGGGTDFKAPLDRALQIIAEHPAYQKADVLMISDGDCTLPDDFIKDLPARKQALNCMVYLVLCAGNRVEDSFSDEVMVL